MKFVSSRPPFRLPRIPLCLLIPALGVLSATATRAQDNSAGTATATPSARTPAAAATPSPAINAGRTAPNYPTPYPPASVDAIKEVAQRILGYLDHATPVSLEAPADFRILGYEWGVTYVGMLRVAAATGDTRYRDYAIRRLEYIAERAAAAKASAAGAAPGARSPLRSVIAPRALDDAGSMCFAMIEAEKAGASPALRPWIQNYIDFISHGQLRFADGTLARMRPLPNTLWLDDLYMSVPALVAMGGFSGEKMYYDDGAKQFLQFSGRMFVREKGLYMHGWVQQMDPHPVFPWGRANGWALITASELLAGLPENHPARPAILETFRAHMRGLAALQGSDGLWHQLLDRPDSYTETSASAMFVYCAARGINRGWLDPLAYGPMASLGWNAVAKRVNAQGQVDGTCVGTGMAFDPMFYCYRPASVYAAHGYGPVLLAASEMIGLRQGKGAEAGISDSAVQFQKAPSPF